MAKLNQIIAVANGRKTKATERLTELYHKLQKGELFNGLVRTYKPSDDDGETCPSENKNVLASATQSIEEARQAIADVLNITATQDVANCEARADIVVDDAVLLANVPVTHLLYLEKQLVDIRTFVTKLPVLDAAESWSKDHARDCYTTSPVFTNKTKKVMKNHVKAAATDKHPAQVDVYTEDVKVGEWQTVKLSSAVEATAKRQMLERVNKLVDAVKVAREKANELEVKQVTTADTLLEYVFDASLPAEPVKL